MSHTSIALITVVYRNYKVLDEFLNSLDTQSDKNFHLFIADLSENKETIRKTSFHTTILPAENFGYAHGVNRGLEKALENGFQQFCIMNDDTYFNKDFVKNIKKSFLSHPHSIIGGKIYYAPGYEYHKERYSKKDLGNVLWYAGGSVDWNHALTPHRGVDQIDTGQYNTKEKTQFVNGCLMLVDSFVVNELGLWDESYFMYYEDSDYCIKAQRKGIALYYDPSIMIWHKNAQSTGGSGSQLHEKYLNKNRLKFGLKYAPWKTKLHLIKNLF